MSLSKTRAAGLLYLFTIITGMFAAFTSSKPTGDIANFVATLCYVAVTLLLYLIFKPVNGPVSLLAAIFSLIGCVLGFLDSLHLYSSPINNLVFFGVYCILIGHLIFRSTFAPHLVGALMMLAGLGWLTFISQSFAHHFTPWTMVTGLIGEGSLTIWLLLAKERNEVQPA